MCENKTVVLDTPEGVAMFMLLALYHKLKLEVDHPNGPKWRMPPAAQARQAMGLAGWPCPSTRKAKVLEAYQAYLISLDPALESTFKP